MRPRAARDWTLREARRSTIAYRRRRLHVRAPQGLCHTVIIFLLICTSTNNCSNEVILKMIAYKTHEIYYFCSDAWPPLRLPNCSDCCRLHYKPTYSYVFVGFVTLSCRTFIAYLSSSAEFTNFYIIILWNKLHAHSRFKGISLLSSFHISIKGAIYHFFLHVMFYKKYSFYFEYLKKL